MKFKTPYWYKVTRSALTCSAEGFKRRHPEQDLSMRDELRAWARRSKAAGHDIDALIASVDTSMRNGNAALERLDSFV